MIPLDPIRFYAECAVVGALTLALGTQTWRLHSEQSDRAVEQIQNVRAALRASETHDAEQLKQREIGDARVADREKAIEESERKVAVLQADAAIAAAATGRLSARIAALVASAREARSNPQAAQPSEATQDPIGMFADVLGRCSARVRLLADYADAARIAGETCERSYNSLTVEAP